jgi:hypothetical protein
MDSSLSFKRCRLMPAFLLALSLGTTGLNAQTGSPNDPSVFGVFVGSSPGDEPIRQMLKIPADAKSDLIQWNLTLYQDPKTRAPSRYELRCAYGSTGAGKPGLARGAKVLERQGTWRTGKGIKSNPGAGVYELDGTVSLFHIDENVLHLLNPDRSLMVGTGGWSYTLNRAEHSEKPVDRSLTLSQPDMTYPISPPAAGPMVLGIFEGRSPCQGIARALKIPVEAGCMKAKWRVTLYQNPETRAPTTYKVEGSLYRRGAREGSLTLTRGTPKDPNATVYRLASNTEPDLFLLKGDDNVLFFLDQDRNPRVGHAGFSYTLNRRTPSPE